MSKKNVKKIQTEKKYLPYREEFLLEILNNNYSRKTLSNYDRDLMIFEAFLSSEDLDFERIDKYAITQYKGYLLEGRHLIELNKYRDSKSLTEQEVSKKTRSRAPKNSFRKRSGLSSRSVNRLLSSLRSYLTFMINFDHNIPIPPEAVKLIKAEKKVSQVAEIGELISLIEAPEIFESKINIKYRNRAMLEILFSTGMRISELISLNKEHLNIKNESSEINEAKVFIMGKGKKQRFVYLTPRARHYMQRYLNIRKDNLPSLFIPYRGSRKSSEDVYAVRISPNYLQSKIIEYRKRLGISIPTSAHSLRHGFATYLAEKGASPAAIQHLLGHESLQTTTRYVHASDKFAEKTHSDFHPLSEYKDKPSKNEAGG